MTNAERIMEELETLSEKELKKVLDKIKNKYMSQDATVVNENYSWWDNEEDDIYNEK
ncbi:hypothetical protein [Virgibacillus doumboii]|uniref:hypothetical protein n=1 Tax=Virgibacillus doumboii TaxID=2697503 RepID=UPI0013DEB3A8|nr:hypothetical protein [Virgibacillus doumboii]